MARAIYVVVQLGLPDLLGCRRPIDIMPNSLVEGIPRGKILSALAPAKPLAICLSSNR
jgi:hypothetical protein